MPQRLEPDVLANVPDAGRTLLPSRAFLQPADVGRKALATCQAQLKAYEACCEKHLTGRQSEVWSAPQVYVAQAADARADARAGK